VAGSIFSFITLFKDAQSQSDVTGMTSLPGGIFRKYEKKYLHRQPFLLNSILFIVFFCAPERASGMYENDRS